MSPLYLYVDKEFVHRTQTLLLKLHRRKKITNGRIDSCRRTHQEKVKKKQRRKCQENPDIIILKIKHGKRIRSEREKMED